MTLEELAEALGHDWNDIGRLKAAFRHTSWCNQHPENPEPNQRLEFLGDSVLDLLSAEYLMVSMPTAREGALSQARAQIVRTCALAERARELSLGKLLMVGKGADYLRAVPSVLADTLEAVVGAAFQDGGLLAARTVAHRAGIFNH